MFQYFSVIFHDDGLKVSGAKVARQRQHTQFPEPIYLFIDKLIVNRLGLN